MARNKRWKSWGIAAGKLLVVALLVWFVRRSLVEAWRELTAGEVEVSFRPLWALVSLAAYAASLLVAGSYWRWLLRDLGADISWVRAIRAYVIGHLGKYVPGKALVVVLRSTLAAGPGVDGAVAAATVFVETLTMMACGSCLAFIVMLLGGGDVKWLLVSAALAAATGAPTIPPVFRFVIRKLGVTKKWPSAAAQLDRMHARVLAIGWAMMAAHWVLQGVSLWAGIQCLGFEIALWPNLPWLVAAAAMSIAAGFVLLVPAGAGVREVMLLDLLGSVGLAVGPASLATIATRLISIAAELLLATLFYPLARKPKSPRESESCGDSLPGDSRDDAPAAASIAIGV